MMAIAEYDPSWPQRFAREAERLECALGELVKRIDHIGSTAVPGLAAKPVIDIQVAVSDEADVERTRARIVALGYSAATAPVAYLHIPASWPHAFHVHVRVLGSREERRLRLFRDWLRAHPEDSAAYVALKRQLSRGQDLSQVDARTRYSEAKGDFVRAVELRAGV